MVAYLPPGITTSDIGSISGTGADNRIPTFTDATNIQGEANLTFDGSTLTVTGDAVVTDDLTLNSDSAVFNMGAGNDFTITHDGTTGATLAGNPITITSAGAATWSTSSGALTLTSAAAATWSTAAGDLTLSGAASLNVTLTDDDADSLTFANSASNYYNIDTRNTVVGISAHQFDSEDPVMASASNAVSNLALFKQHQVNWSGTTQVTSLQAVVNIDDVILYNDEAMTLDKATGLVIQPPRRGHANLTLSETSGIRITDASTAVGAPAIQSGIHIENMAAGTLDYGLYIADADTYSIFVDDGVSRFDGGAVIGYSGTTGDFHANADNLIVGTGTGHNGMTIYAGTGSRSAIFFADGTGNNTTELQAYISYNHSGDQMNFGTSQQDSMYLKGGASPQLWLTTSTTQVDAAIVLDGAGQDYYIGLHDGGDALFIGSGSTVGSNGAIIIDKKGGVSSDALHVGMNATPNINDLVTIGGAFAGYSNTHGLRIEPTLTAKAGQNAAVVSVAGTLTRAGSGSVHQNFWGTSFSAPTVNGTINVTDTATVIIQGAMTAGTGENYALYVDAGATRFDGIVLIGQGTDTGFATGADNLIVGDGSNHEGMTIFTGNNSIGSISFADAADPDGYSGYIQYGHGTQGEKLHFGAGGSLEMTITSAGIVFINETANANMTTGLTINQGGADDDIFSLKSSDVGHPFTHSVYANTDGADTFFSVKKIETSSGGALVRGFKDSAGAAGYALYLQGLLGEAADTSDGTSSAAVTMFNARVTDGSTEAAVVHDDGNAFGWSNMSTVLMLIKGDGDIHATNVSDGAGDMNAVALDNEDDIGLVRTFQRHTHNDIGTVMSKWDDAIKANEDDLRRVGVLTGDFYSMQRMNSLLGGAIWQGHTRQQDLQEEVNELKTRLLALEGGK